MSRPGNDGPVPSPTPRRTRKRAAIVVGFSLLATVVLPVLHAAGQLPLREVQAGRLDPFGVIDPTDGGATQRHSLSLRAAGGEDTARFEAVEVRRE